MVAQDNLQSFSRKFPQKPEAWTRVRAAGLFPAAYAYISLFGRDGNCIILKCSILLKVNEQEVEACAMTIIEWIFTAVSLIWISEFVLFRNRGVGQGDSLEKRTFFVIFATLIGTIIVAQVLQELRPFATVALISQLVGIVLLSMGVFLRFWGIIHLKSQFTRYVTVREGDEIVSTGPYRKLRHPLYTGLLLITLGMALFFGSLIAAVLGGVAMVWALLQRINYEERLLIEKFGPDYEQWMKKRARLIPFIY